MTRLVAHFAVLVLALCLTMPASTLASNSMLVEPDGKVMLAGGSQQAQLPCGAVLRHPGCRPQLSLPTPVIARFNPDGSLDRGFGSDGVVVDFRRTGTYFTGLALTPSGTIVVGQQNSRRFRLIGFRYAQGAIESAFGDGGVVAGPDLGDGSVRPAAIEPVPGGLLVGGALTQFTKGVSPSFAATSLFGEHGEWSANPGAVTGESVITDLATQPSGDILVLGTTPIEPSANPTQTLPSTRQAWLGRLSQATYSLDRSFADSDGTARLAFGDRRSSTYAWSVVAAGDRILLSGVTGSFSSATVRPGAFVAQFDGDGVLDPSFGDGGIVFVSPPGASAVNLSSPSGLAALPDGRVVVAGISRGDIAVARLTPDGALDSDFGEAGWARFASPGDASGAIQVAPLTDGGLLVSDATGSIQVPFVLARLTPGGTLDRSFGEEGIATAMPCRGEIAERRRSGCISSARVRLRPRHLSVRRPRLRIEVGYDQPLDPIKQLRLILPPALKVDTRRRGRIQVQNAGGRRRPRVNLRTREIKLTRLGEPTAVRLNLRPGLLKSIARRDRGGRLLFRVRVTFADTSTQTIRIRRSGSRRTLRHGR